MTRRIALVFLFMASVIALFAYLSPGNDEADSIQTLQRSLQSAPDSLDPHKYRSKQSGMVLRDIGEGLVGYSPTGAIVPLAARRWDVSEDGLSYTFHLRREARWSNGDPITADHFKYAFERLFNPSTGSQAAPDAFVIRNARKVFEGEVPPSVLGVRASGPDLLTIELEKATPHFLQILADPALYPLHPETLREHEDRFVEPGIYLSNGAYVLTDSQATYSRLQLERNPHYWGNDNSYFDRVVYVVLSDRASVNAFRTGEIDFTDTVPVGSFDLMKERYPDNLFLSTGFSTYYYGLNLKRAPFEGNPRLREALSMAIDRELIVSAITGRGETPAYSLVPPGTHGYESQRYTFSGLSRAQRERAAYEAYLEAGYSRDNPVSFELRFNASEDHRRIALAIQSMWRDVLGAKVELVNEEFKVLLDSIAQFEKTQAYRLAWSGSYLDPQAFLQILRSNDPNNLVGYSNTEFDKLMEAAATELSEATRYKLLEEAEARAMSEFPLIPIYHYVNKHMVASDIEGLQPNLLDIHYSKNLRRGPKARGESIH